MQGSVVSIGKRPMPAHRVHGSDGRRGRHIRGHGVMISDDDGATMIRQPGDPVVISAPLISGNDKGGARGLRDMVIRQCSGDAIAVQETMSDLAVYPRFRTP